MGPSILFGGRERFPTPSDDPWGVCGPLLPLFLLCLLHAPIRLEISFGTGVRVGYPRGGGHPFPLSLYVSYSPNTLFGRDLLDWIYVFPTIKKIK
ncbi:hypothetical protein CDAR_451081 [Caerostris darwini]|uniref:Uncharacterized protein n=1 Tax=Caerostris darwini TaxID=1538125 RepID=A0AAV4PMH3_9ARAC|nr:hypothetical protein CDAR_451081 [Caerostris darwini]